MFGYSLLNKIPSCQTATATRTAEKAIGLISKKKEIPLPEQHTFLYISLPLFCTTVTMFLLARFMTFYGGNSVCADLFLDLLAAVFVVATVFFSFLFFSLPLIITLVAAYFLTAPLENCHVLLPTKYIIPLRLLSLALALSSVINVNVDIKTYLVEEKTRICCCCCFFPLKVRVAMRFTTKTGARVLEMRKFTLAYMKEWTDERRTDDFVRTKISWMHR